VVLFGWRLKCNTIVEARVNKLLGVILIVAGIIGLAWGGITYTTQKKVVDIGPIKATKSENHTVPVPPIAGAALLIGGIVLVSRR
jgi:uncharacterized membrane protein YdcZ (DUF606 family)